MTKYSDAQKEATARYNKKAYDRIDVIVKKGQRQIIKDFAASQGKSLNKFICDAIEYQMNKSKETEWTTQSGQASLGFSLAGGSLPPECHSNRYSANQSIRNLSLRGAQRGGNSNSHTHHGKRKMS